MGSKQLVLLFVGVCIAGGKFGAISELHDFFKSLAKK